MEQLNEQLTIENASIEEWTHRRTKKDGLKVNFTVSAMLPRLLADQLKCGGIYDNDTKRVDLTHKLKDIELIVPVPGVEGGLSSFFPDVLYAFHALRDEQQFTLEFSVHVTVRAEELHEILKGLPDVITLSVRPRQGQLFEGGTRVDVTPTGELLKRVIAGAKEGDDALAQEILAGVGEPDTGCVACNNAIPMRDDRFHMTGVECTKFAGELDKEAPLVSAVTMGGTHQKRKPRAGSGTVN